MNPNIVSNAALSISLPLISSLAYIGWQLTCIRRALERRNDILAAEPKEGQ